MCQLWGIQGEGLTLCIEGSQHCDRGATIKQACWVLTFLLLLGSATAANDSNHNPLGFWKLDLQLSDYSQALSRAPKAVDLNFTADSPSALRFSYTATGEAGTIHVSYDGAADGKPHPISGVANVVSVTYIRTDRDLRGTWKLRSGSAMNQKMVLSPDGKTMASQWDDGAIAWYGVYRRVEPSK